MANLHGLPNYRIGQSENTTFSCEIKGVPDADIIWLLDGRAVQTGVTGVKVNSTLEFH